MQIRDNEVFTGRSDREEKTKGWGEFGGETEEIKVKKEQRQVLAKSGQAQQNRGWKSKRGHAERVTGLWESPKQMKPSDFEGRGRKGGQNVNKRGSAGDRCACFSRCRRSEHVSAILNSSNFSSACCWFLGRVKERRQTSASYPTDTRLTRALSEMSEILSTPDWKNTACDILPFLCGLCLFNHYKWKILFFAPAHKIFWAYLTFVFFKGDIWWLSE